MNIILFEKKELTDSRLILRDHRASHIVKVLKSNVGDILRVGEVDGDMGRGVVVTIKKKYPFIVELSVSLTPDDTPFASIDLLLALPRPIMLKRILSQVTALGVGHIYLINASRVEKSFWDAGIVNHMEYRPHLLQGLEQAVDTHLPGISIHRRFKAFVEDVLPEILCQYGSFVVAHPDSTNTLSRCLAGRRGRVLYGIGPEGGWGNFEIEKFKETGMTCFSTGPRILKVDTAVVAIHGRIEQLLEGRVEQLAECPL